MIRFRPLTLDAVDEIGPILEQSHSRTCDYTVAGLLMWSGYFHYEYAVIDDTLFIKGVTENDVARPAYSLPVGKMPTASAFAMLRDHCAASGEKLVLSGVRRTVWRSFVAWGRAK